jgi:hypothetical protein
LRVPLPREAAVVIPLNEVRIEVALQTRLTYDLSPGALSPQVWLIPESKLTRAERIEYDRRYAESKGLPAPVLRDQSRPLEDLVERTPGGRAKRPVPMEMRADPDDDDIVDLTEFE